MAPEPCTPPTSSPHTPPHSPASPRCLLEGIQFIDWAHATLSIPSLVSQATPERVRPNVGAVKHVCGSLVPVMHSGWKWGTTMQYYANLQQMCLDQEFFEGWARVGEGGVGWVGPPQGVLKDFVGPPPEVGRGEDLAFLASDP